MHVVLFILSLKICEVLSVCSPKDVKLINFQKNPKRSKPFMVEISATRCPGMNIMYYEWEVKDMSNNKVVQTLRAPLININGYEFNFKSVFSKTYQLTGRVSHYEDMRASSSVSETFQFTPDKMHIEIKGGTEVVYPVMPMFEVDAKSLSKDISFKKNEHRVDDNDIEWTITPQIPGFYPSKILLLRIPYPLIKENETYHFTVKVTRTKIPSFPDVQTASQTMTIVPAGTPKVKIECIRNCKNSNPKETTIFRAVCTENCKNLNYEWSTKPLVEKKKTDLINKNNEFVIEAGAFERGDKVSVILKSGISAFTYPLEFEQKMTKGTCLIKPKTGISGITLFNLNCLGFTSSSKTLKYMIYQMNDEKGVMVNEDTSRKENNFYLSVGSPAKIVVQVHDGAYEQMEVKLEVEVQPFPLKTPKAALQAIKNLTFAEDSNSIKSSKLKNEVVQTVSYLLNAISTIDPIADAAKNDLHMHLAELLEAVSSHDFDSSHQMILILTKLQRFKIDADTRTSRLIGKSALRAVTHALIFVIREKSVSVPVTLKIKLMEDLFYLSSKLLDEIPKLKSILVTKAQAHDYDSYDEMTSSKLTITDDIRDLTNNLFLSIQCLGIAVLDKNIPDQKATNFQNDLINFATRRVNLTTLLENQTVSLTDSTGNKVLVSRFLVKELQEKYKSVDYQFGVLQKNIFYWYPSVSKFNTDVVLFDFFHQNHKIRSMKNPFHVHLKVKAIPRGIIEGDISSSNVVAHRIEVQPGSTLIFVFKAEGESFKVAASKCYCNEEDFVKGVEIQNGANESARTLRVETFNNKNVIYVCIKKSGAKLHYEGSYVMFSCAYWDFKVGDWKSGDSYCSVEDVFLQEGGIMVCKCTHSSFFTGQIFAPPNQINLNLELDFYIAFIRNWFVFALIVGLLLIWSFLLLEAFYLDRKHLKKNKIHRLDDNVPGDCHIYVLVVFTGVFIDAGTTADVAFQLIGENAESRVHVIKCTGVRMLQRNSQDWFIINTPRSLGRIKKIRLWHNCKGTRPHWYCKRIVVQHLKSGTQFCFIVEKWFSLVWGSGKIYREIFIKTETYLKSRKLLLSVNVETQFKDKHLWVSVFTRDSQSNFSSLERIGSIGCTFFLSMLASAMFYGIPKNAPVDSIDPKSSYFITYHDIIVFIESWLVAVPIGIIVVLMFRNSAPRIKVEK